MCIHAIANTEPCPRMNGHSSHMSSCDARRCRDPNFDIIIAKIFYVLIEDICLSASGRASQIDIMSELQNIECGFLSHRLNELKSGTMVIRSLLAT